MRGLDAEDEEIEGKGLARWQRGQPPAVSAAAGSVTGSRMGRWAMSRHATTTMEKKEEQEEEEGQEREGDEAEEKGMKGPHRRQRRRG